MLSVAKHPTNSEISKECRPSSTAVGGPPSPTGKVRMVKLFYKITFPWGKVPEGRMRTII